MRPAKSSRRVESRAVLYARVAALYYLEEHTQAEIARRLRIPRSRISTLLRAARAAGIVRIAVMPPDGVFPILESEIEARFDLREVRVVALTSGTSAEAARLQLGAAAAAFFARSVRSGHSIGVAGGELLASMIDAIAPMATSDVRVVQGVGGEEPNATHRTLPALVCALARRIGAMPVLPPVPVAVCSEEERQCIEAEPCIGAALRRLDALDAFYLEVASHQAVAANAEQLARAKRVVALARGASDALEIAASARTGLIDTLITDEPTARALAALPAPRTALQRRATRQDRRHSGRGRFANSADDSHQLRQP